MHDLNLLLRLLQALSSFTLHSLNLLRCETGFSLDLNFDKRTKEKLMFFNYITSLCTIFLKDTLAVNVFPAEFPLRLLSKSSLYCPNCQEYYVYMWTSFGNQKISVSCAINIIISSDYVTKLFKSTNLLKLPVRKRPILMLFLMCIPG